MTTLGAQHCKQPRAEGAESSEPRPRRVRRPASAAPYLLKLLLSNRCSDTALFSRGLLCNHRPLISRLINGYPS
jgi:hypothetical protein